MSGAEMVEAYRAALHRKAEKYRKAAATCTRDGNTMQAAVYREVAAELSDTASAQWPD